ncbi:glycosyltransferase, partial [Patescibacteria group bacterium]|nr:glycosyltransferase [Patescibacteria group bacterium]
EQTFKDFEIILVDNQATDRTIAIAKKYKVNKIINIKDKGFSHAYSTNIGIEKSKGDLMVLTNAHCVPMFDTWLEDGIRNFNDPKVAGIDGHYTAGEAATSFQKATDKAYEIFMMKRMEGKHISSTNAIIRKDLWERYRFDESLLECEDYDWSKEMLAKGYKTIKDPKFNVYHLHSLTMSQWVRRNMQWRKICKMIDKRKRPYGNNL